MKRLMLVWVMILCMLPALSLAEDVFAPQGEWRVFSAEGLYGMETLDGEAVIPARFSGIYPVKGDLCVVMEGGGDDVLMGLWRLSSREELLPCQFQWIEIAGNTAMIGGLYDPEEDECMGLGGLYDPSSAKIVAIPEGYDGVWSLADGALFALFRNEKAFTPYLRLIKPDGTPLLDQELIKAEMGKASNGIIMVMAAHEDSFSFRYYNTVAEAWLEGSFDWALCFVDGYAAVKGDDRRWHVIDESGKTVSPPFRNVAFGFNDDDGFGQYGQGLFAMEQDDGWYLIRVSSESEPEVLLGPVPCDEDPLYVGNQVFAMCSEEGTLVFSAADGRQLMLEDTTIDDYWATGCSSIRNGDKVGFLFDNLTMIEPAYDDCIGFLGDYGFVKIDEKWYPIDRNGQVDMSVSYPCVEISEDGEYYRVEYDDCVLCLNPELQPITCISVAEHG